MDRPYRCLAGDIRLEELNIIKFQQNQQLEMLKAGGRVQTAEEEAHKFIIIEQCLLSRKYFQKLCLKRGQPSYCHLDFLFFSGGSVLRGTLDVTLGSVKAV